MIRHDNRQLYRQSIDPARTPIKHVTTQFAVVRNRTVQVVRKQFPLRPAAAKTIHRSQGDTETRVVVNFDTKRAIPHIHYVGLSRVTTIEGLYITDLCENKMAVSEEVKKEMERLRSSEYQLPLSITPLYKQNEISFKLCFLNARSLHKHINDVRRDFNYSSADVNVFCESRFMQSENDQLYEIGDYSIYRNDGTTASNERPYGGTAVYSRVDYYPGYPYRQNTNGIEITVLRFMILPHVTIIALYRSPKVPSAQLKQVLLYFLGVFAPQPHAYL